MKRMAVVSGRFYNGSPAGLRREVEKLMPTERKHERALGIMAPHAGYMYSGAVAGLCYGSIEPAETYLLLGPNHTGLGAEVAIMDSGTWEVPTGAMPIDARLASLIRAECPHVRNDSTAHSYEHSIEVQLPFILAHAPNASIVPIAILTGSLDELKALGSGIARAVRAHSKRTVIVASSDMSHYLSDEEARAKDRLAIDRMLALDPDGLYHVVLEEGITMCGFMPAVAMLSACIALGAKKASLLRYATSAETSGDFERVVGYAGIMVG